MCLPGLQRCEKTSLRGRHDELCPQREGRNPDAGKMRRESCRLRQAESREFENKEGIFTRRTACNRYLVLASNCLAAHVLSGAVFLCNFPDSNAVRNSTHCADFFWAG